MAGDSNNGFRNSGARKGITKIKLNLRKLPFRFLVFGHRG